MTRPWTVWVVWEIQTWTPTQIMIQCISVHTARHSDRHTGRHTGRLLAFDTGDMEEMLHPCIVLSSFSDFGCEYSGGGGGGATGRQMGCASFCLPSISGLAVLVGLAWPWAMATIAASKNVRITLVSCLQGQQCKNW